MQLFRVRSSILATVEKRTKHFFLFFEFSNYFSDARKIIYNSIEQASASRVDIYLYLWLCDRYRIDILNFTYFGITLVIGFYFTLPPASFLPFVRSFETIIRLMEILNDEMRADRWQTRAKSQKKRIKNIISMHLPIYFGMYLPNEVWATEMDALSDGVHEHVHGKMVENDSNNNEKTDM